HVNDRRGGGKWSAYALRGRISTLDGTGDEANARFRAQKRADLSVGPEVRVKVEDRLAVVLALVPAVVHPVHECGRTLPRIARRRGGEAVLVCGSIGIRFTGRDRDE